MTPKDIRKIRGELSRAAFAMMVGTSEVTIWRWENGEAYPEAGSLRLLELMESDRKATIGMLSKHVHDRIQGMT